MAPGSPGGPLTTRLLEWVYRAARDPADPESRRQALLLHSFATMGTLVSAGTCLAAALRGDGQLAIVLAIATVASAASIYLFHVVRRLELVAGVVVLGVAALFLYLAITGGTHRSGPFWTFVLPPLAIYLLGQRRGGMLASLFVAVVGVVLLLPGDWLALDYPMPLRPRWMAALLCVLFISLLAERSRQRTYLQLRAEIQARQHTEQALRRAKEQAEQAAGAKSEFLANMSHELRTPLSSLLGMNSLLIDSGLRADQQVYARRMRRAGAHLLSLINDVLDLSRLEADELRLEHIAFDPGALTEDVVALFRADAEARALRLQVDIADAARRAVQGDPARIRQVLGNLVGNALKFTEQGEVTVALSVTAGEAPEVGLRWSVRDTGIGIPTHQQADIFEQFRQADGSTTRRFGGTGLGLAICRRLAQAMGGQLGLHSVEGQGSTFWFELSLSMMPDGSTDAPAPASPETWKAPRELRLLAVDDDEQSRFLVQHMASRLGCGLELAASGQEAIAAVAARRFDLVLMDCHMPGMDGYQTTQAIRALEAERGQPAMPIVAVTANVTVENRARCEAAGMDEFMVKPFGREDLEALLARRFPPVAPAQKVSGTRI